MSTKKINEDLISIKHYHRRIDRIYTACRKGDENNSIQSIYNITERDIDNILDEEINKKDDQSVDFNELLNGLVASESEHGIEFEYLFVSLGRIVPIIDKLVAMLCMYNIGSDVVSGVNTIESVQSALVWLYYGSTDADNMEYQDIQRIQRLLRDVIALKERKNNNDVDKNGQIDDIVKNIVDVVNGANDNAKKQWIRSYKEKIKKLINVMFDCYDCVHKYFDLLCRIDKDAFEDELKSDKKNDDEIKFGYKKVLLLAQNVLNVILRRLVAYAKIRDINFPHAQFAYSDLISVDLSNSNFISADFSCSDLTDTLLRTSDISVANLSFCRAHGSDLTDCKLNSSNLVGSNFENANLIHTQMTAVKFREQGLDSSYGFYGNCDKKDEIRKFFDERNELLKNLNGGFSISTYNKAKSAIREFFGKLSLENQENILTGNITEEWQKTTCANNDAEIGFKTAMDDICTRMEQTLSGVYETYRMRTVPFKLLYEVVDDKSKVGRLSPIIGRNSACFKYATLTRSSMPDADVSYVSFCAAMLDDVDLSGSWFFYTDFSDASLKGANVSNGDFYGATLNSASCTKANFMGSALINCDLNRIDMNNGVLINTIVISTDYGENIENKSLQHGDADVQYPYINGICKYENDLHVVEAMDDCAFSEENSMCDANLDGVVGNSAIFAGLNMDRSSWRNAVLKKVAIFNCVARWTYFNGADFSYAMLLGVSFHQGSLAHVLMAKSRLYACDMSGVSLNHAALTGSRIERTIFQNADLGGANLSRARVINCAFSDVNLDGTNIGGTLFKNVVFDNVDFSRCIGLDTARFENCVFGNNCNKLEFPFDFQHRINRDFMSIMQGNNRLKFFRQRGNSGDNNGERNLYDGDRYTSLTFLLNK